MALVFSSHKENWDPDVEEQPLKDPKSGTVEEVKPLVLE